MEDLPVIDRARLELVTRGNAALAAEFIDALLEEGGELIEGLAVLVAGHDGTAVSGIAHRIKGMAIELGAMRLRAMAAALEKETDSTRWPGCITQLRLALDELRSFERR